MLPQEPECLAQDAARRSHLPPKSATRAVKVLGVLTFVFPGQGEAASAAGPLIDPSKLHRCLVVERAVWPHRVVIKTPRFDELAAHGGERTEKDVRCLFTRSGNHVSYG